MRVTTITSVSAGALLLLSIASAGCRDAARERDAQVSGKVTLDGELAHFGKVAFHPLDEGPVAYGQINEDGSYSVRTGRGELDAPNQGGLASGQYVATVIIQRPPVEGTSIGEGEGGPRQPGQRLSPEIYASVETSPLVISVRPGANVKNLALESRTAEPTEDDTDEQPASSTSESGEEAADEANEETGRESREETGEESGDESEAQDTAPADNGAEETTATDPPDSESSNGESSDGETSDSETEGASS